MKEIREVLTAYEGLAASDTRAALATVVSVEGSSYRRPGARMLVGEGGILAGTVSGGCLEADVAEHAHSAMLSGKARLLTYDTRSDDDALFGLGTGCKGEIKILVERVDSQNQESVTLPGKRVLSREPSVLALVFESENEFLAGRRCLVHADGSYEGSAISPEVVRIALDVLDAASSRSQSLKTGQGQVEILFEYLQPSIKLILCGAGPDAVPLSTFAHELGWMVTLIDHRPHYLANARYESTKRVLAARPGEVTEKISCDSRTAVVVMTHDYAHDLEYMSHFCAASPGYIGLLGSHDRAERLLADLREGGVDTSVAVHAPVGLKIGGTTPESIALSIVAEIQASFAAQNVPGRTAHDAEEAVSRDAANLSRDREACRA